MHMARDPEGLSDEEMLAEARELGADGPRLDARGLHLAPSDAQAVLGAARRARLGHSALRKAVAAIPNQPNAVRFKPAELRLAIRTLERRLAHVEPEVAKLKAAGQDRGHPHAELAATTIALARLQADLDALR